MKSQKDTGLPNFKKLPKYPPLLTQLGKSSIVTSTCQNCIQNKNTFCSSLHTSLKNNTGESALNYLSFIKDFFTEGACVNMH